MNYQNKITIGCSYPTIFMVLLILKVSGVVDWAWWIILAPLWLIPALVVSYLLIGTIAAIIVQIIED